MDTDEVLGGIEVSLLRYGRTIEQTQSLQSGAYHLLKVDYNLSSEYTVRMDGIGERAANGHRYLAIESEVMPSSGTMLPSEIRLDAKLQCADCGDIQMPEIYYSLGKWDLVVNDRINSKDSLKFLLRVLELNPSIVVEIGAHTDTRGSDKPNGILSQKRAEMCAMYLMKWGIEPERMVPVGYGESRPLVTDEQIAKAPSREEQEKLHAKNRRTVFRVLSFDYEKKDPIFMLCGNIIDTETKEPLGNVQVKLLEGSGYKQWRRTNDQGYYEFLIDSMGNRCVNADNVYTVEINGMSDPASNGHRYLGSKGQESTVDLKESTKFIKDFELMCADCIVCGWTLPKVEFAYYKAVPESRVSAVDSLGFIKEWMDDNPGIILEAGIHGDSSIPASDWVTLSKERKAFLQHTLTEAGVNLNRVQFVDYHHSRPIISEEEIMYMKSDEERMAARAKNERCSFAIISFDYKE